LIRTGVVSTRKLATHWRSTRSFRLAGSANSDSFVTELAEIAHREPHRTELMIHRAVHRWVRERIAERHGGKIFPSQAQMPLRDRQRRDHEVHECSA
jgi:hypothetical protein